MRRMFFLAFLLCHVAAYAQYDTLSYDGITNLQNPTLLAMPMFPGEADVYVVARFSPTERCYVRAAQVGFGFVKFLPETGNDTLIVLVFEHGSVPPVLTSVVKTYTVNLGDKGFPNPNINTTNPLENTERDMLTVPLDPAPVFSPRRDFYIGVKVKTQQVRPLADAAWNGFSILVQPQCPQFDRFRRYQINEYPPNSSIPTLTMSAQAGAFLRAVVQYDPSLKDSTIIGITPLSATGFSLEPPFPNPSAGTVRVSWNMETPGTGLVEVIDALGRQVALVVDGMLDAGSHQRTVQLGTSGISSGTYYVRMRTVRGTLVRPLLFMK